MKYAKFLPPPKSENANFGPPYLHRPPKSNDRSLIMWNHLPRKRKKAGFLLNENASCSLIEYGTYNINIGQERPHKL